MQTLNKLNKNIVPQVKSALFQYMMKEGADNFAESQNSSMAKQIGAKIGVLEVINGNIKENIDVIQNYNADTHDLKIGGSQSLVSIFNDHKDEKEAAEEYSESGLPDLKKIVAVKKPKKDKGCGGILMVVVGVVQIIAGAVLCCASFGALAPTIGKTLIMSGISDVFTGVSSLITGEPVDWKKWKLDKVGMIGAWMLNFGMSYIGKAIAKTSETSFGGAILRGLGGFMKDKGQHLVNAAAVDLQRNKSKDKNEPKIDMEQEARKIINQRKQVVLQEWKEFIENANIDQLKNEEEKISGIICLSDSWSI